MWKGLVVGLANPKMVLFFVAFFPQFIDPSRGSQVTQMLVLGAVFWLIGTVWDVAFALASGTIGGWLHKRPLLQRRQARAEGAAYVVLALWTATSDSR